MSKLVLSSDDAIDAVNGDHDDYKVIVSEIVDEWRWGVITEVVVQDTDGKYWSVCYKEQSGDEYYNELQDLSEVEFTQVTPVEVMTIKYVEIKD